ncbi:MAG: hypothetical protein V1690_00335 [Candidatus Moraniibacteriota bacterium]
MPGDIKTKKVKNFLKKILNETGDLEIKEGGRHLKVKCVHNSNGFTVPCSHRTVNIFIMKDFRNWLIENEIFSEDKIKNL